MYFAIRQQIDGKRVEESLGWASRGWTLAKARGELAKLRDAARTGEGPTSLKEKRQVARNQKEANAIALAEQKKKSISTADYWLQYQDYICQTLKPSSFRAEAGHIRLWILPLFGELPLVEIELSHWDALIKAMDKKGLSQRTKEYCAGTLRRMLNHAADRGLPVTIPASRKIGAQGPQNNNRQRVLTKEESESILKKLLEVDMPTYRLTKFCMLTGCRLSEATFLQWSNVNLQEATVTFVNTKNKDNRMVYMAPALIDLLKDIPHNTVTEYVFLNKHGKPFIKDAAHSDTPLVFRSVVQQLALNEGRGRLDRVSFHTIRHTAATNLAKVLDVRALMDVMGWKVIAMAARYVHTQEDAKRAAATVLAEAWG